MSAMRARDFDDRVELVAEDDVVLTPSAALVLARIVRQHLDDQETPALSAVEDSGGAH
jgi:hypothetical protein